MQDQEIDIIKIIEKYNYWGGFKLSAQTVSRNKYLEKLEKEKDVDIISAIVGVRRSGKSTILLNFLEKLIKNGIKKENTLYLNMEESAFKPFLSSEFLKKIIAIYKKEISIDKDKKYIVIDEVQNIPSWELALRNLDDTEQNTKIFITGSSAKLLSKELGSKLSGRYLLNEVFPLDWQEYQQFKKKTKKIAQLPQYLSEGSFPKIILETDDFIKKSLLNEYFNSILLRDIGERYNVRNIAKLRDLAIYLFTNNANLIAISQFVRFLDISPDTVSRYFEYIENAYLGFFIPQFATSLKKQIYNPKKFYSIDLGLAEAISFRLMDNNSKQLENLVFLHLRHKFKDIFYWQGKQEVDFLVRQGLDVAYLINVSYSIADPRTRTREIESLKEAMLSTGQDKSFIITLNENEEIQTEFGIINVVSFDKFFSQSLI